MKIYLSFSIFCFKFSCAYKRESIPVNVLAPLAEEQLCTQMTRALHQNYQVLQIENQSTSFHNGSFLFVCLFHPIYGIKVSLWKLPSVESETSDIGINIINSANKFI